MSTGEIVPVEVAVKRNSKSITIRPKFSPKRKISVSKPWHTSDGKVKSFLETKRAWLEKNFAENKIVDLQIGDKITILDNEYTIAHPSRARLARTAQQKFLAYAKKRIAEYSAAIGKKPAKLTIRDTSSRWGSCSEDGNLCFSFRLAFAPEPVARYIIAHEMAHMLHFDHSPKFWAEVARIYGPGWQRQRDWLTKNGQTLYKYL